MVAHHDLPQEFVCPHCNRTFDNWKSCDAHLHARKHDRESKFCGYKIQSLALSHEHDISAPDSFDAKFGYFQMSGRRPYMEGMYAATLPRERELIRLDMYIVHQQPEYAIYAIVDGHSGLGTASFLRDHLVDITMPYVTKIQESYYRRSTTPLPDYDIYEQFLLRDLFKDLHSDYMYQADLARDFSGSTLTIVFRFPSHLLVANVGDSTAALLSTKSEAVDVLSVDHWPNVPFERARIEASGGFVEFIGVWRVVGQLAISRSIGDHHLRQYVSLEPSIRHVTLQGDNDYLIVASDGIWETLNPRDVLNLISEKQRAVPSISEMDEYERAIFFHDVAAAIVFEAYVRGSTDNMAVLLVAL